MTSVDDVRDDLYTLYLEFFATGEGVSVWAMVTVAPSEADAREHFWFVCFGGDERLRDHYGPGL